jgi:ABC-2 type transport system permease protein
MSLRRMTAIFRKEVLHIVRDPRNLFLVTISPAFLLFLLAYVFSFDVDQLSLAVLDLDQTALSRRYLASLTSDQDLIVVENVRSYEEGLPLLRAGHVDAVLVIPPNFSDTINAGAPSYGSAAQVQAIVDGADPFSGSQALLTLEARSEVFVLESLSGLGNGSGLGNASAPGVGAVAVRTMAWYNAGQESLLGMVPGLLAIVLIMPTMALALALTREKETGTLEGLIVTPVSGLEYLGGKLLAYVAAGLVSAVLALLVAVLWFQVPFRGSLPVYLLLAGIYLLACMGTAVVIANFASSQQTAMFVVLLAFLVPSFFLAGLTTPIATNSVGALLTSYALPTTHFVEIGRGVFLKGLGLDYLLRPALILLGMGISALLIGLWLFQKRVS